MSPRVPYEASRSSNTRVPGLEAGEKLHGPVNASYVPLYLYDNIERNFPVELFPKAWDDSAALPS